MAFIFDETWVNNGQLIVAEAGVNPKALGEGIDKVKHSAYVEGPLQVGNSEDFATAQGTVMIGKDGEEHLWAKCEDHWETLINCFAEVCKHTLGEKKKVVELSEE